MKDLIQQITNIQGYCAMIVQNGTKYKSDVFMNNVDLDVSVKLMEHYNVTGIEDNEAILLVIEDENCKIYINHKK